MAAQTGTSVDPGHIHASTLIAAAQRLAVTYTKARLTIPQLPAAYQSARPWFIILGRSVASAQSVTQSKLDS